MLASLLEVPYSLKKKSQWWTLPLKRAHKKVCSNKSLIGIRQRSMIIKILLARLILLRFHRINKRNRIKFFSSNSDKSNNNLSPHSNNKFNKFKASKKALMPRVPKISREEMISSTLTKNFQSRNHKRWLRSKTTKDNNNHFSRTPHKLLSNNRLSKHLTSQVNCSFNKYLNNNLNKDRLSLRKIMRKAIPLEYNKQLSKLPHTVNKFNNLSENFKYNNSKPNKIHLATINNHNRNLKLDNKKFKASVSKLHCNLSSLLSLWVNLHLLWIHKVNHLAFNKLSRQRSIPFNNRQALNKGCRFNRKLNRKPKNQKIHLKLLMHSILPRVISNSLYLCHRRNKSIQIMRLILISNISQNNNNFNSLFNKGISLFNLLNSNNKNWHNSKLHKNQILFHLLTLKLIFKIHNKNQKNLKYSHMFKPKNKFSHRWPLMWKFLNSMKTYKKNSMSPNQ